MRDLLTGLAIILIVALTTMLVAPYFVDWNGQRGFLEAQLTRALGQPVTIGGDIDLKLLPTPYLRLNQAVVGGDDGAIKIGIRHLDLELAVAPLLHGEFDIVEGRLDEPTIRLTLQPGRTLPALPDTPALRANVRLERIVVVDGTLAVADPQSGRTFVLDHLDFGVEAPSLAGPFRGSGTQGASAARTKFRFSTTEAKAGRARLRLGIDETSTHPAVDLDGDVGLRAGEAGDVRQSFDGTVSASGQIVEAIETPIAWRLSGPLKADSRGASFGDGELRVGGIADDGLAFQADGEATFGDTPDLRIKLDAKQLDIDRLSGPPVDGAPPPPPKLPGVAALRALFGPVPLQTTVDVGIDGAVWGGEALSGLSAHAVLGREGPLALTLVGDGPGGLHLDLAGTPTPDGFTGRIALAAEDLRTAQRWLGLVAPQLRLPSALPLRSASVAARLRAGTSGFDLADMTLGLDRSTLTGSAHVTFAGTAHAKLAADLTTDRLDLDTLPSLRAMNGKGTPLDVALKLDAKTVHVTYVGAGPLEAGHVRLDLASTGGSVVVDAFEAQNLGGATVKASGRLETSGAALTMHIDAARLEQAAALVRQLAPGPASDALLARAADLAPATLTVAATFAGTGAKLAPSRIDASGTFAATQLDLHLAPDPGGDGVALDGKATSPRGDALLRQLGFRTLPLDLVGPGSVTIAAKGAVDHRLDTKITAVVGGTRLDIDGRFDLLGTGRGGSGTMKLASANATPLLQSLAVAPLDLAARLPVTATAGLAVGQAGLAISDIQGRLDDVGVAGTLKWQAPEGDAPALTGSLDVDRLALGSLAALALGPSRAVPSGAIWSTEPFAPSLVDPPRLSVVLHAKALDLGLGLVARDAGFELGLSPGVVALKRGAATLSGGRIGFALTLRRDGAVAALDGTLDAGAIKLQLPAIRATISGKLDVAGSGRTPAALVASLAGTGDATLAGATVEGIDATALPKIVAEVEADTLAVDEESIVRAFVDTANGSIDAGVRRFALGLAGGTLAFSPQDAAVRVGSIAATLDGAFDLRRLRAEVRVGETLTALPKGWTGPPPVVTVTQAGAPTSPARAFDVSGVVNALAARAIARESARIEAYEFDLRERAFFNARLQSDRRREQDRLKAEADAKAAAEAARAEAERRAKAAEAARLDKLRAEQRARDDSNALTEPRGARTPDYDAPRYVAPPRGAPVPDPSAAGRY